MGGYRFVTLLCIFYAVNFRYSMSIVCKHKILPARFHADSFSSPGHPLSYPSNYNCSWTLIAPEGYQVEIVFRAILTESCCDIIELRDGNSSSAGLLATFRGSVSEFPTYISSFGSLYIRFKTDDSLVHDGFHAEYRIAITKSECSAVYTALPFVSRNLTTPGWPSGYENDLHCRWTIISPKGKRIAITFKFVDTEKCCDYILVRFGDSMESKLQELGGSITSDIRFISTSEKVQVVFRSDHTVTRTGFRALFTAVGAEEAEAERPLQPKRKGRCGGHLQVPIHGHQVITTPRFPLFHPNNLECVWILTAPTTSRLRVWFTTVNTEECCDFIKVLPKLVELKLPSKRYILYVESLPSIRDGQFPNSRKLGVLSGERNGFLSFVSSKNSLRIEFESDMAIASRGFRAVFEVVKDTSKESCGGDIRAVVGMRKYISSPNWPSSPSARQCSWKISTAPGLSVVFNIIGFLSERNRDEVVFYNGHSQSSILLGVMNGRSSRTRFVSTANTMLVVFNSDFTTTKGGFRAFYKAVRSRDISPQPLLDEGTTSSLEF